MVFARITRYSPVNESSSRWMTYAEIAQCLDEGQHPKFDRALFSKFVIAWDKNRELMAVHPATDFFSLIDGDEVFTVLQYDTNEDLETALTPLLLTAENIELVEARNELAAHFGLNVSVFSSIELDDSAPYFTVQNIRSAIGIV